MWNLTAVFPIEIEGPSNDLKVLQGLLFRVGGTSLRNEEFSKEPLKNFFFIDYNDTSTKVHYYHSWLFGWLMVLVLISDSTLSL